MRAYVESIFKMDPNNKFAQFILCKNEEEPMKKIEKLKELVQIHPDYIRSLN